MSAELNRILDEGVPPIPPELRQPPLAAIRRRVRHARLVRIAGAGVVALAVLIISTGTVVALRADRAPSTVVDVPTATPTPRVSHTSAVNIPLPTAEAPSIIPSEASTGPGGRPYVPTKSVWVARVAPDGRGLSFFVNTSQDDCLEYPHAVAHLQEGAQTIVVTISAGTPTLVDCAEVNGSWVSARLAQPLGTRTLRAADGATIRPFFDADMPSPPATWTCDTGGIVALLSSLDYMCSDNVPGGNEVFVYVSTARPNLSGVATTQLGSRQGVITGGWALVWTVRDLYYELWVEPREGLSQSEELLRDTIAQMTWP